MSEAGAIRARPIDPAPEAPHGRLIAALDRRRVGAWNVTAAAATAADGDAATGWWRFTLDGAEIAVAPLLVDGAPPAAAAMRDAASAAALLAPAEPLLAALEAVLGGALDPAGLGDAPGGGAGAGTEDGAGIDAGVGAGAAGWAMRVEAVGGDGAVVLRLLVAAAAALPVPDRAVDALPLDPAALAAVPVAWRATIAGPALAGSRLARLARGDMLLLGAGPLRATLDRGGIAQLDFRQGTLIVQEDATVPTDIPPDPAAAPDPAPGDAPVRLAFAFAGGTVPAGRLATLAPGGMLPLPTPGAALAVEILAGEASVGAGELVPLGDGFGVVVTRAQGGR